MPASKRIKIHTKGLKTTPDHTKPQIVLSNRIALGHLIVTAPMPSLSVVSVPTINGVLGPTFVTQDHNLPMVITWPCQNSGAGAGSALLHFSCTTDPTGVSGDLITIPGFQTVTVIITVFFLTVHTMPVPCTILMEDQAGTVLGTWAISFNLI